MKTQREILLKRHQAVTPKLDTIRRGVLDTRLTSAATSTMHLLEVLWRELIWPCRRIWTGLAAAWVLIFLVNFSGGDNVSSVTGKPVHSCIVQISWQVQQRWMNELLTDRHTLPDADRSRNPAPRPRTEMSGASMV